MGFMHLACTPEEVDRLKRNWKMQTFVQLFNLAIIVYIC